MQTPCLRELDEAYTRNLCNFYVKRYMPVFKNLQMHLLLSHKVVRETANIRIFFFGTAFTLPVFQLIIGHKLRLI